MPLGSAVVSIASLAGMRWAQELETLTELVTVLGRDGQWHVRLWAPGSPPVVLGPYQNPEVSARAGAGMVVPASRISEANTAARADGPPRRLIRAARLLTAGHSFRAPARTGDTEIGPCGANRAATVSRPATPRKPTFSALTTGPGRPVLGLKSR